ncbi:hypothetical protein A3746_14775 [Oleibacter sp. HI0075]|nr:hypothetical protein A3746_14775 [Oleibacter sp. HI0075]
MKLTQLSLTNFRSFKDTQSIDIAPVTLLFGPNSVGKSSVLMALAYVQQILEKGHCDPQKLDALGNKTIGGFRSLVHGGDLNSTIKIKLDFELGQTVYREDDEDYDYLADAFNAEKLDLEDFSGSVDRFAFELEIAWAQEFEWAFVQNYRVWVNNRYVGCVESSEDLKNTRISELNLVHPLLLTETEGAQLQTTAEDWDLDITPEDHGLRHTQFQLTLDGVVPGSRFMEDLIPSLEEVVLYQRDIGVGCQWGAVPTGGERLGTNLNHSDLEPNQQHLDYLMVSSLLTSVFLEPVNLARQFLRTYIAIGPMRVIPDFDYVPDPNPAQSSWADGRAAWDLLHKNPETSDATKLLIKQCNQWLSDADKLDTGYELKNWSLFEAMKGNNSYDDSHYLIRKRHLLFVEKGKDYPLAASQLGTGISQVLPVLVAAHQEKLQLISVEQPELHLHPRFQVELGDLFLSCSKDRSFLIETHSEHLVLRLLRRLREDATSRDNISVCYLKRPEQGGVVAESQVITDDGDFEHDWPDGFFDERDEELF